MPGPLPSMRLKAWRRGLQDAELYRLAYKHDPVKAEAHITSIMPSALVDGQTLTMWSSEPSD